ncbi:hypothetical protein Tco_0170031 [Tanacetum coccineum]
MDDDNDVVTSDDIKKIIRTEMEVSVKEAETKNGAENMTKNKPIKKAEKEEAVEAPSSQSVEYYLKHMINEKLIEGLVDNHRSGKSKISFNRKPESLCKDEKGVKNDIKPIAPTMTVNRLVLEWEEKIKLHQEKEMEFDRWRNKNFKNERHAPVKIKDGMGDEGEVTSKGGRKAHFLMDNAHIQVLGVAGDGVASIKRRRRDQSSDDIRIMAMASGRGRLKEDLESST